MLTPTLDSTDASLVEAVQCGSVQAFDRLHARHHDTVVTAAGRVLRDHALAEEVVQEIFLDLWRRPQRFDAARGSLASLLVVQARSRAIDRIRSDRARRSREDREGLDTVALRRVGDEREFEIADRDLLASVLCQLDDIQRAPIMLAFYEGYTYREVADRLGVAEGTIKSRIRSGLREMRAALQIHNDPVLVAA